MNIINKVAPPKTPLHNLTMGDCFILHNELYMLLENNQNNPENFSKAVFLGYTDQQVSSVIGGVHAISSGAFVTLVNDVQITLT